MGSLDLGPVAPFDAAICCLAVGGAVIALTWTENYGQRSKAAVRTGEAGGGLAESHGPITSARLALCDCIAAAFRASASF